MPGGTRRPGGAARRACRLPSSVPHTTTRASRPTLEHTVMRTGSFVRSSAAHAALAVAALFTLASAAGAQYSMARYPSPSSSARQLFVWEGRVDREVELVVRDDRLVV